MANPNTAIYPANAASDSDLLVALDVSTSTLAVSCLAGDGTITVASGAKYTQYSAIQVENEVMMVTAPPAANVLTVARGVFGTTAAGHASGVTVQGLVYAWHHNQVAAEVKAIEAALRIGPLAVGKASPSYPLDVVGDINTTGQIRVNGSAIPTGSPDWRREVPSGALDGSNKIFTLSATPGPAASLQVTRNGIEQLYTVDYSLSGNTITFVAAPKTTDVMQAQYAVSSIPTTTGAQPWDIVSSYIGNPAAGATVTALTFTRDIRFQTNFAGSGGTLRTNPGATAFYTVKRNGATIGTVTISAAGVFTFATSGTPTFAAGDRMTVVAPTPQDTSLADVAITFAGLSGTQSYDIVSTFIGKPVAGSTVLALTITRDVLLAANFRGSVGSVGVNPAATAVYTVARNGSSVGTISVSTGGVFTFATSSGAPQSFAQGDRLTITAPNPQDSTLADAAITLAGSR